MSKLDNELSADTTLCVHVEDVADEALAATQTSF